MPGICTEIREMASALHGFLALHFCTGLRSVLSTVEPIEGAGVFLPKYDAIKMKPWQIFAIFTQGFTVSINKSGFYFQETTYAKQAGIAS